MTDEEFLLSEYGSTFPTRLKLEGKELIVPASYKGDIDAFTDDLTSFQNNEYKKYERHNEKNPDNNVEPTDIISDEGLHVIVPLSYAKKDIFDENGVIKEESKEEILEQFYKKARKRYFSAVRKTRRYKKEYPDKQVATSLSNRHLSECRETHKLYIKAQVLHYVGKTAKAVAKAAKWTAEEAVNIAAGTAASPLALVYKFMDKKHRIAESSKKQWIDEKALPYIKRGVLKIMVIAMSYGGIKVHSVYDKYQEEKAKIELQKSKERAEKEAFFKKYNTNNETFYQNYKIAKENEAMIVALIACPEGFKSEAYLCSAGKPTKGYGTTRTIKKDKDDNIEYDEKGFAKTIPVVLGTTTTKEDGYDDVVAHLDKYVYPQLEHINKVLEAQEMAAVCMFIYNTDEGAFKNSMVCVAINNNESDKKVREAFSIIRSVGGLRSYGLINRHGFEGYVFCCENIKCRKV
ncbi:MAG: lysozyme [Alphaproteobacteria bacterium]|nr:lysozyme [Alphaproteobacteria bacterium]